MALSVRDVHTGIIALYPVLTKTAEEVSESLRAFMGKLAIDSLYSDNAREFIASGRDLAVDAHHFSPPGMHQSNSLIERTNQIILGGTTASLVKAGLPPCYWSEAGPCFCVNYNAAGPTDPLPWSVHHDAPFPSETFPFGCLVIFRPGNDTAGDVSEKWDPPGRQGIFAGYSMRDAVTWGKAYRVWDLDALRGADLHAGTTNRLQRVPVPQMVSRCQLPVEEGVVFPIKAR